MIKQFVCYNCNYHLKIESDYITSRQELCPYCHRVLSEVSCNNYDEKIVNNILLCSKKGKKNKK